MMGKTSRWFRALLGSKKLSDSSPAKDKKKQGFAKSSNGSDRSKVSYVDASSSGTYEEAIDANKHAIAVAAATAAVAEAALAAAQAAAEVVRLTSGGSSRPATAHCSGSHRRRDLAAVKIQSAFRAYLARRALRALKGLVRLQALVRGHIVRKQSADMLRRMQALARIQARACSNRAHIDSLQAGSKSFKAHNAGLATPRKQDNKPRANNAKSDRSPIQKNPQSRVKNKGTNVNERTLQGSNWLNRWMEECSWNTVGDTPLMYGCPDDDKSDKILEVDTWNPHISTYRTDKVRTSQHATSCNYSDRGVMLSESLLRHSTKCRKQNPSISSGEALSLSSIKFPAQIDETAVWTTENSPQVYSASSRPESSGRKGPFTPARSECSRSFFSGYPGYPNYMANTESYRAKVRSQSAPRQRIPFEKLGSTTRFFPGYCDSDTISECGSTLHDNYRNKAYLGSGRSDRPVIPVRGNSTNSSTYAGRS